MPDAVKVTDWAKFAAIIAVASFAGNLLEGALTRGAWGLSSPEDKFAAVEARLRASEGRLHWLEKAFYVIAFTNCAQLRREPTAGFIPRFCDQLDQLPGGAP